MQYVRLSCVYGNATNLKRAIRQYSTAHPSHRILIVIRAPYGNKPTLQIIKPRDIRQYPSKPATAPSTKHLVHLCKHCITHTDHGKEGSAPHTKMPLDFRSQRCRPICYFWGKLRLVYVYAYAGYRAIAIPLAKYPANLATIHQYVIRPFYPYAANPVRRQARSM